MVRATRPLDQEYTNEELLRQRQANQWARRRDIPLAILAWTGLVAVILWAASHVIRSLLILAIAALLAFALAPIVKLLERIIPRLLAVLIVYLVVLGIISTFCYFVISAAVHQTISLAAVVRAQLGQGPNGLPSPLDQILTSFGVTPQQIAAIRQEITAQAENFARNSFPLLRSVFDFIFDTIVVAVVSIYLLLDGSRAANWIRRNAPNAARAGFVLDTLQRVVGGYIRGQVTLAILISLLVYLGMQFIFHLPFAVFLGVLAFVMAFIPVLGTLISGAVCVLIGLTEGWLIAVGVLVYFIVIHILEGDVVGPRIVGKAVGLHPVVSLLALVAGGELFGIWGALFASPIAGVLQALIIALWTEWQARHPEQFHTAKEELAEKIDGGS